MKIFALWIGLICCAIANGVIYDYVDENHKLIGILIPSIIALILLVIHRIYTRNWTKPIDDKYPGYPTVFTISTGVSFFVLIITLLSVKTNDASWGAAVGVGSAFVFFLIAWLKEMKYCRIL